MTESCGSILLIDDDADFRSFVAATLQGAGFETAEAANGEEALDAASALRPDVVLLDVYLPGIPGYAVLQTLRTRYGETLPIILVSGTRREAFDRVGGLLLGADDYLFKPLDPDELVARVRRMTTRSAEGGPAIPEGGPAIPSRATATSASSYGLTARERQILARLMDGRDQKEIAQELVISPKTVSTHIQRVLSKLGVHSRAQAVALAARERLFEPVA